jgi:glycine/D-amino acid oxidase-like deaminating enzyme
MRLYHPCEFDFSTTVGSYWEASADPLECDTPELAGSHTADVAIIGGGYAGLHAALRLAGGHGLSVRVLEAGDIGWGASGRNGGFCCPGSVKLGWKQIISRFGPEEARRFYRVQREAVEFVGEFLAAHGIEADRTGSGELEVAHAPRMAEELQDHRQFMAEAFQDVSVWLSPEELEERGYKATGFHGGLLSAFTFGLHPLKYVRGLANQAVRAGAVVHARSEVTGWTQEAGRYVLRTAAGQVSARTVLVATNGYTDETLPPWLGGRLLPALTQIIVTRPISDNELKAQGWLGTDPTYDSRTLLHYFRLLPDNRFLFGGRGGTDARPAAMQRRYQELRAQFDASFPALAHVETDHRWGGLVCLTSTRMPYAGPLPGMESAWGAFGWHGNGVAMASYAGHCLADVIAGEKPHHEALPAVLRQAPGRFILPDFRVHYLKAAYLGYGIRDRMS